jgi:hypothetical protein
MQIARKAALAGTFLVLLAAATQAQTTAFTYQGQLKTGGVPTGGNYDFKFELYDAVTVGNVLGTVTQTLPVAGGLFTASLDFGNQFPGANRWLQISVRTSGGGSYTLLTPRQALKPAPYAIGLELPFAGTGSSASAALAVTNSNGGGMAGIGTSGPGVLGTNTNSTDVNAAGVYGQGTGSNGNGVSGRADTGTSAYGVYAHATDGYGVYGQSVNGTGIYADCSTGPGVHGVNYGSTSTTAAGVVGESGVSNGNGVAGIADNGAFAYGVYGEATGGGYAGYFSGNVYVGGILSKAGGSFKIDHPLDPANKYLSHSFVESPDMKNVYDGVVTTDADGYATVTLPDWFQTLNRDFRYQLTVIDDNDSAGFVQAKIAARVSNNQFTLRTSEPQTTVSWQVTGIRQDPWANAHRIPVEQAKPEIERGLYLHPELYGASAELGAQAVKARAAALNQPVPALPLPAEKAVLESPVPVAPDTIQESGTTR